MRKIYQSAPDVPQPVANKAVDIIERHFVAGGVRRAEDLSEESKVHLLRELQRYFESQASQMGGKGGAGASDGSEQQQGFVTRIIRRLQRFFGGGDDND